MAGCSDSINVLSPSGSDHPLTHCKLGVSERDASVRIADYLVVPEVLCDRVRRLTPHMKPIHCWDCWYQATEKPRFNVVLQIVTARVRHCATLSTHLVLNLVYS